MGWPSPAQDYANSMLKSDPDSTREKPSVFSMVVEQEWAQMGLRVGDELLIDRAKSPRIGDLVVVFQKGSNEFWLALFTSGGFKGKNRVAPFVDAELWGTVSMLVRVFV